MILRSKDLSSVASTPEATSVRVSRRSRQACSGRTWLAWRMSCWSAGRFTHDEGLDERLEPGRGSLVQRLEVRWRWRRKRCEEAVLDVLVRLPYRIDENVLHGELCAGLERWEEGLDDVRAELLERGRGRMERRREHGRHERGEGGVERGGGRRGGAVEHEGGTGRQQGQGQGTYKACWSSTAKERRSVAARSTATAWAIPSETDLLSSFASTMSRHRLVKNLDLDDELDDAALDSGEEEYDDLSPEQAAQMAAALPVVHAVLGDAVTERTMRAALWDSYFDPHEAIAFLLDEQHKKAKAQAKADGKCNLVPPPARDRGPVHFDSSDDVPAAALSALALAPLAPSPPLSKLAAKVAASKAAAAAAATAPKLSKLQLKMVANQAAKLSKPVSIPLATLSSTPAPPEEPARPEPVVDDPPVYRSLLACPSPFAAALTPRLSLPLPLVHTIIDSFTRSEALTIKNVFASLSPDDVVLKARQVTGIAVNVVPKRK